MLILAFDTATDLATSALVADGEILGERTTRPQALLADVDALLEAARLVPADLSAIVVGTGPGSFTGTRIGLSVARGLALSLDLPVAGVSTVAALAAADERAFPVVDARRGEVFVLGPLRRATRRRRPPAGRDLHRQRRPPLPGASHGPRLRGSSGRLGSPCAARLAACLDRELVRPGRRRGAGVRPRSRREAVVRLSFSLRRLELSDLDAIERIELASYPTPWSRSMFASELAKQSSLSIAAVTPDERLVGYLVLSRYVDAWHVMNVAVDPEHRRLGIASAMLRRLFEVTRGDAERGYTLEVRVSNLAAISLYESFGFESRGVRRGYYTDNREDALIMWRDPEQPETTRGSGQ